MTTPAVSLQDMGELSNLLCFCYNQADRRKMRERVMRMFKRGLCFLTAAVFLLLAPAPGHACEHYGPDTPKSKLVRKGYVEPQVGVPGYTGDYHCPVCDAIVIKGKPLAAADDPANSLVHPQEIPDTPADPGTQAGKDNPEKPAEPEKPVTLKPDKPTAKPKKTAKPKATATPKVTVAPKATDKPKKTGSAGKPVQAAANKNGEGRKWVPFSRQYPYRRVRMQPEEGIYAEAAGILIWPVPASPFRKLFDD